MPARDIVKMLSEEQGRQLDCVAVAREKEAAFEQLIPQIPLVGRSRKLRATTTANSPWPWPPAARRRIVTETLRHLGIAHLFQAVVTSEDVARQKPAPDIYLEAARRLGVPPQNCRAYEDTDLGLDAIRAAGMEAVDVRPLLAAA